MTKIKILKLHNTRTDGIVNRPFSIFYAFEVQNKDL